MNLSCINSISGRIHYFNEDQIFRTFRSKIFQSNDEGTTWDFYCKLKPESVIDLLGYTFPIFGRFARKGVHHLSVNSSNELGVIYNKNTAILKDGRVANHFSIVGSRPLSFESIGDEFVFGEYRSNMERTPIGVFALNSKREIYKKLTMSGIRHIHGIYQDPYTDLVWITTGDDDDECALICTDTSFTKLDRVLAGSQQTRAIKLLFTKDHIYFGSDAPEEVNYIYRMNKETNRVEKLVEVGNTVFHGCRVGDWLFFSTAVEPSKTNLTKEAQVWGSPNGIDWKCLLRFKKDKLPLKAFQYGQVFFPAGNGNGEDLWVSPFATKYSNKSFKYKVSDFERLFNQ